MLVSACRWRYKTFCRCFCALLIFSMIVGGYFVLQWCLANPLRRTSHSVDASEEENVSFRRDIATQLADLTRELKRLAPNVSSNILLKLNKLISQLDPRFALSSGTILSSEPHPTPDTCQEEFKGTRYGYPFHDKGFEVSSSCRVDQKPRLSSLVTVLILDRKGDPSTLKTVLEGVKIYNDALPISLATTIAAHHVQSLISQFKNTQVFFINKEELSHPGKIWNTLIKTVKTPYVLLAKDIFYFNSFARLERQIFVISNTTLVGVVGGAFRNESGHWKVGCHVSQIKNYLLKYTEGYQYSAMDCMFCDLTEGPFIAKTNILQNIQFKNELPSDVVFEDWFLRVKQENILVMNCPDVMYFKQGPVEHVLVSKSESKVRDVWLALAREWQVDRILFPSRVSIRFSCEELQLTCDATRWFQALLIPPCCLVQVTGAFKALDDFSKETGVDYEIEAGTLLGAVKLGSFLPWDRDGDITFLIKDINTFYENSDKFSEKGFSLSMFQKKYFRLNTPEIILEMWGSNNLSTFLLPSNMWETPTRMKFLGMWVRGEWNPGLFARNRYGPGYLKHVQHWGLLGMSDSWVTYKPGSWKACPKKAHHGCLDQYPTDGNIGLLPDDVP